MEKRPRLKGYHEDLQEHLDVTQSILVRTSSLPEGTKKRLLNVKGYVCDVACGRAKRKKSGGYYFTIPHWAYRRGTAYFRYYVAHELAHLASKYRGHKFAHDKYFYQSFKDICPEDVQHYEFPYKPRVAKQFGLKEKV